MLTFLASFSMAFLMQKLIYTINIWFNVVLGSFFKQDHLLNLIILGGYAKGWPKCARISKQKQVYLKIWSMNFFLTLTVRGPFHRKDFKWKKYGGTRLISEKTDALYVELNERAEACTRSYSASDFSQFIYSVLVIINQKKIRSRCLVHEFPLRDIF